MRLDFDATAFEPQNSFEPLPPGWYTVTITAAEQKIAKSGNGEYLQLEYVVACGEHEGRRVWERLNMWNSNATAVEIANNTLAGICGALGIKQLGYSEELINQQLDVKLKVRKSPEYGDSNDCMAYRAVQKPSASPSVARAPWQQ